MSRTDGRRGRILCEAFEPRDVPAAFPIAATAAAISPDGGGIPTIKIVDPTTGEDLGEIQAYEDAFRGGVRVALGDVTGDGVRDVVIAPGVGGGPRVRIVDGQTGQTLRDFFVYEPTYTGGIYVSLGDVTGDGRADIVTGTGVGGGPRVRVLDGGTLGATVLDNFFAYEGSFRGGVLVAAGDTDGDGRADIVTGTGVGGGPRVQVFSGTDRHMLRNYFAFEDSFRGGVLVAAGDTNGDGRDDIVNGTGPGGGPVVRVVSGADGRELSAFLADDSAFRGGVNVDARDLDGDGRDDVIARVRRGNDDSLRVFDSSGRFRTAVSRVVDDNPSPNDVLEGKAGAVTPGGVSHIDGTFVSADAAANTVTIRLGGGGTLTAAATAGTEVKRDKANATLASFQPGDRVEVLIGPDGVAWEIEAKSAAFVEGRSGNSGSGSGNAALSVEGTITAVDATANTVSIRTAGGTVTLVRAAAGTKVERNDRETTLAAFVVGDFGEAKFGTNGIATKIEARAATTSPPTVPPTVPPPPTGTTNPPANSKIEGTITAVDAAAGTVTIRGFLIRTTASTKVERNDAHTTLSSFRAGDFGEAEIGGDGFATKVEAEQV